jgi:class 3 adenylate cyclase
MLELAYERGGSLLKFGGDALLLLFTGEDRVAQACSAAVEMRAALRSASQIPTSVGRVALKMSVGLHDGPVDLFRVGASHNELIITGPTASITTEMEATADAGEILVSGAIASVLPPSAVGAAKGDGFLLRWRSAHVPTSGAVMRRDVIGDVHLRCLPVALRSHLVEGGGESEHRLATVGFVKFKGIDAMLHDDGPAAVAAALDELVRATQAAADAEGVTFLATDIDADGGKIILTTGVPTTQEDDEGRMLRAVRAIVDSEPALPLRCGVNRGHVFAGEIGTTFRATYTVMGDAVNLASRLEGANKDYGTRILLSETTYALVSGEVVGRRLGEVRLKGKRRPVRIYELRALGVAAAEEAAVLADFELALSDYEAGRWEPAEARFRAIQAKWSDDGPTRRYLEDLEQRRVSGAA